MNEIILTELNATKLRIELAKRNWSQAKLAREMHISRALLNWHVKGKKLNHIGLMADALGIDKVDLILAKIN